MKENGVNMSKNKSFGKISGIVLCILSIILFIVILVISSDIRGYTKLLDKYYLSIQRGTASDFDSSYENSENIKLDDIRIALLDNKKVDTAEDYFKGAIVKYKINDSENTSTDISTEYNLNLTVTVSIDDDSYKTVQELTVGKIDGKWKIIK